MDYADCKIEGVSAQNSKFVKIWFVNNNYFLSLSPSILGWFKEINKNKNNNAMEVKKSPKADLENKRNVFLWIGLVVLKSSKYYAQRNNKADPKESIPFVL